jgi:hypothetical protein
MKHFDTATEAMEDLRNRGYTQEFSPKDDHLEDQSAETRVKSNEFEVDEFHRFEGTSDPGDEMTVYAISTHNGLKGIFVSAQGTYANEASAELMAKFNVDHPNVNTEGAVKPLNSVSTD